MALLAKTSQENMASTEVRIWPQLQSGDNVHGQRQQDCVPAAPGAPLANPVFPKKRSHAHPVSSSDNEHRQGGPKRRNSQGGENKQTYQEAVHVGPDVCTDAPLYLGASKRLLKVAISNYISAFPSFCFWVNSALISNDASRAKEYSTDESRT